MIRKDIRKLRGEVRDLKEAAPAAACLGMLALAAEMWNELHEFRIKQYQIRIPYHTESGEEVKLVFLSDLHGKCYGEGNRELIAAIKREAPDGILIGGDMLTRGDESSDEIALCLLKELAKIGPVYLANGNHEQKLRLYEKQYDPRYQAYRSTALEAGVILLENDSIDLEVKGLPVTFTGLEIPEECYELFHPRDLEIADVTERIGESRRDRYQILLAHNPVYFDTYAAWGADLTLSGHLHGGIIGIPGYGGLITPQAKLFPRYSGGIYRRGDRVSIVSRGLGTHTANIRLFNPAGLIVIRLNPGKESLESAGDSAIIV